MPANAPPFPGKAQKRINALPFVSLLLLGLLLRTSAQGQGTLPGLISVAPQPFWSTLSLFHLEPKISLAMVAPAFLTQRQPDYAAANGADFSAFADLSRNSSAEFSPALTVQEKVSTPVAVVDLEPGSAHLLSNSSSPELAGKWSQVAGVGSTIPDFETDFGRPIGRSSEAVSNSQTQAVASPSVHPSDPQYGGVTSKLDTVQRASPKALTMGGGAPAAITADQTWSGGGTGNNTAWTSSANWVGGAMPGSVGTATNTDIATIPATGTNPAIGISGTTFFLGAINLTSTANRAIGSSGTTGAAFALQLNGATVNGVANTILRASSTGTLTLQPNNGQSTPNTLSLALGNSTNNIINIDGSGGININAAINGSLKNLTLNGTSSGILTFGGTAANSYSGTTTVNVGELDLNKTASTDAVAGNLVVGDAVGAANSATVKHLASSQINDASNVTVNSDGVLSIGTNSDTVGSVVLAGGNITGSTGTLTGSSYAVQSGSITAKLGGAASMTKTTSGTVTLSGANTFTGSTTIAANGGTLVAAAGSLVSTSSVTVNSGGTLLLSGNGRHLGNATGVTLQGGTFNTGGLTEPGGTPGSQRIGALTLTSTSTIDFGAGNLSVLEFAGVGSHTASTILQIVNWDGIPVTGGSGDRLLFDGLATTFTTAYNQSDVSFNGMSGYLAVQFDLFGPNPYFEITSLTAVSPSLRPGLPRSLRLEQLAGSSSANI